MIEPPLTGERGVLAQKVEHCDDFNPEEKSTLKRMIVDYERLETAGVFVKWGTNVLIKAGAVVAAAIFLWNSWGHK